MLFSEPKIPQFSLYSSSGNNSSSVSVLFSEPKIPQLLQRPRILRSCRTFQCSSASRKFLNALTVIPPTLTVDGFSALQRAENSSIVTGAEAYAAMARGFSALQRAENSSIQHHIKRRRRAAEFQCSSASRKFLNPVRGSELFQLRLRFSALQRAENSSISVMSFSASSLDRFQCSSASRKFLR